MIVQTAAFLQPTGLEMLSAHQELSTEMESPGASSVPWTVVVPEVQGRYLSSQPGQAGDLSDILRRKKV